MRGSTILERCKIFIKGVLEAVEACDSRQLRESVGWLGDDDKDFSHMKKLLLGIGVVTGGQGAVDWHHELADWLDYLNPIRIKIPKARTARSPASLTGPLKPAGSWNLTSQPSLGHKLTVTADHVGLVTSAALRRGWTTSPRRAGSTTRTANWGWSSTTTATSLTRRRTSRNPEEWGLEPPPKPAAYSCLVRPPDLVE